MLIRFIRFIKGYLVISFTGKNAESMLNVAAKNGINIWGLYCKKQCITGCITLKDFKHLKRIKRSRGVRVKIIKKCGTPFILKKYNKRVGLIFGIAIFAILLHFLSNHIWIIDVEGNEKISKKQIINSCVELGITEGILSSKINPQIDAQRLILLRDDIAWASLNIEGCHLDINITEIEEKSSSNKTVPTNLKASCDGIIKRIDVTSGDVVVKTGDVVKKGDVLVSGIIERLDSTVFVYSSGKIIAETEKVIQKTGEYIQELEKANGKIVKKSVLSFFGIDIPLYLGTEKHKSSESTLQKNLKLFNKRMPICYTAKHYSHLEKQKKIYTKDELSEILLKEIDKEIESLNVEDFEEKETVIEENDLGITVSKTIICYENIAYQDEIIIGAVD